MKHTHTLLLLDFITCQVPKINQLGLKYTWIVINFILRHHKSIIQWMINENDEYNANLNFCALYTTTANLVSLNTL